MYLATQFFFEASVFELWEKHIHKLGNKLDIHAGIPGPANIKTLISYARSCGIGNSIRFLSNIMTSCSFQLFSSKINFKFSLTSLIFSQ